MNNNEQHYFLTYGRGVFKFMLNELKFEFNSVLKIEEETELTEGKFHFILLKTTTNYLKSLLNLKTVERVFLSILFEKLNPHENTEIETLLNLIQNSIQNSNLNQKDQFQLIIENKQIDPSAKRIALPIKFRINCKLRGKWKNLKHLKQLIIDKLIQQIELINLRFKYSDDNDYNFEIICHLNDISLLIGIPISKEPLSKRDYIIHSGLRSTTCAIMIQLAEINTCLDTFILDPFSGVNTILTEYYGSNKDSNLIYISSDSNINQLHLSQQNLSQFNSNLICSNLNFQLPYRNNIFDLIITDLPFGLKWNCFKINLNDYFRIILNEFDRLLSNEIRSRFVILINKFHFNVFEAECVKVKSFLIVSKNLLSLGETNAYLIRINKQGRLPLD